MNIIVYLSIKMWLLVWLCFGSALSVYVPNEIDDTTKPYTTGLKIKTSHYKAVREPYYHSNYSKVYVHNKNYTSSLLGDSTDSHATQVYPVYISEEKKEKIETVLEGHNTNVVEKDTLNNRVVYKRRIEKSKNIEVFNRCPKGISGQFVYDLACNQYLDCWNGRGGPRNCGPGTLFNPKTLECDFPEKVECLTGPTGSSITLQKSAKLQSQEQARCPDDFSGLIPNYTDCSKFVQCNNGIQTSRDCPPGTLFDTNINVCNHAKETICFSGQHRSSYGIKEEYGGSTDITGFQEGYGQYTGQNWQQQSGGNVHTGQTNQHSSQIGGQWNQYGHSADQGQSTQFYGQNNQLGPDGASQATYGGQNYRPTGTSGQGTFGCDPTNPYCKSGGYIISGHNIYSMYPRTPEGGSSTFNFGQDSGGNQGSLTGTVYVQYVMCNPNVEDCSTFQKGTYMLGPGGALCNPVTQQCGPGTAYIPTNKMPSSNNDYGQNPKAAPGTYFVKYVVCNTVQEDCSQYQKGIIEAAYGLPNTFVNAHPVEHSTGPSTQVSAGCNPQSQNCGTSSGQVSGSHGKSGQPCNPLYQRCDQGNTFQGQYGPSISSGSESSRSHGQPCNPQYQECVQNSYNQNCNPLTQNCGRVSYQGQNRPDVSSYDQLHESQGTSGNRPGTGYGTDTQTYNGTTNYKKVCTAGDEDCYRNRPNLQTNQDEGSEAKCPNGYQGLTKHPTNCKQFLNCANGITYIQDCAPGTLFNPNLKICDFPYNVDCKNDEGESTTLPYNEDTYTYQGYPGCQGQACQSRTPCQGPYCADRQGYGNQDQAPNQGRLPFDFIRSQYGKSGSQGQSQYPDSGQAYGGYNKCVGSQCSYRPSGQSQDQNRCQGSECVNQDSIGNQGQTVCQCGSSQGQRRIDGQGQVQGHEDETSGYSSTTIRSTRPTIHQGVTSRTGYQGVQPINKSDRITSGGFSNQRQVDYVDIFDPNESKNIAYATTTQKPSKKPAKQVWPPPFPDLVTTDLNADYVFEYEDGEPVTLAPEIVHAGKRKKSRCGENDFVCDKRSCVAKNFVCDSVRDCDDGKDEKYCQKYLDEFKPYKNHRLDVLEKQRWDNVTDSTCALLCMDNKKFECKSFNYRKVDRACFLTDENVGSSGALKDYYPCVYYERKSTSVDCSDMHKCPNGKCLTSEQICDGYDDCGDRADEKGCRAEDFGYSVKLAAGQEAHEGRIEVTVYGKTGYICDDQFSTTDADVICKELGFELGALEVKGNSYFAKDLKENHTLYMMDDIECLGNETSIMQCNFAGWGIHNCADREIAGVVCKTPQETCREDYWKCDTGNECVRMPFVCDGLDDCSDNSDEASHHCNLPTELRLVNGTNRREGRLEIRHNGIWGSVCDDDFNEDAAKITCASLGFYGSAVVKKDAFFGQSPGPIWLDQVSCKGNESSLEKCTHWDWGEHNCDHSEDVGVVCSNTRFEVEPKRSSKNYGGGFSDSITDSVIRQSSAEPVRCGLRKDNIFLQKDDVHFRVVQGSVAKQGDYPWQAALRIKGQEKTAHWCGAVVISSKWVLTAAHCLEGYPKGAYIVVAGEYNTDENEGTEQQAYIEEYYLHENFRQGHKMGNDIAMVLLKGNGFRLNQDIQPICLPDENSDYERELNCTISGFGTVQTGRSAYSHKLRAAWIPVQKMNVCKMAHIYGENIGEGMICAGHITGGIDACDGDSGGPLACLEDGVFTLYGITSWGQRCGYANKPGVYVKVSHYKKWIENIKKLHS